MSEQEFLKEQISVITEKMKNAEGQYLNELEEMLEVFETMLEELEMNY